MRFSFFTLFMFFIIWFTFQRIRLERKEKDLEKKFWAREQEANATRRKDISGLSYLEIPLDKLPFDVLAEDEVLASCEGQIRELAGKKILNLTGYSNTELKLMYGAPNLTLLTNYDQNFTLLVRELHKWAGRLYDLSYPAEAACVLEFAIGAGSDKKNSYLLLGKIYSETGQWEKINSLKESAMKLNSLLKDPILKELDAITQNCSREY